MTKTPIKRKPVPADVKAARKLLDELVDARREMLELRKLLQASERRALKAEREVRMWKGKQATKGKTNG